MPPHSPSRSPSASTSAGGRPAKRSRHSSSATSATTPSLLSFFGQRQQSSAAGGATSPFKSRKTQEELDLERAIAESLKDHEAASAATASQAGPSNTSPIKLEPREDAEDATGSMGPHGQSPVKAEVQDFDPIVDVKVPSPSPPPPSTSSAIPVTGPSPPPQPAMPPCQAATPPATASSARNAFSLLMSNSNVLQPTNGDGDDSPEGCKPLTYLSTMPYASTSADLDPLLTPSTLLKLWSHSDAIESKNRALRGTRRPRGVPFYKVLTGMPLAVDAFRFGNIPGCVAYFLSHAHSDHYAGLSPSWSGGPIYCTPTTANLIASSLRVPEEYLRPVPLEEEVEIPNSGGVRVTLLSANHCPGSCVFLFRGPRSAYILPPAPASFGIPAPAPLPFIDPKTGKEKEWLYLHCGDFRASPYLLSHPRIKSSHLDIVYLDTTYLNPRYCFPAQEEVVRECGELSYACLGNDDDRRQADEQRRTWEKEGIREEDTGWRNIKGIKEERAEEMRRRYEGERKGMQGWLGGKSPSSDEADATSPVKRKNLDTLAKGLFRYDDDDDDGAEDDLAGSNAAIDAEEEEAWMDAHDLDVDVEKREVEAEEEAEEEPTVEATEEPDDDNAAIKSEDLDADFIAADVAAVNDSVKIEDLDANAVDDNLAEGDSKNALAAMTSSESKPAPPQPPTSISALGTASLTNPTNGRLLVVVGTYSIGKEKIALSCALRLGTRIFCCDTRKYRIFSQLEDEPLLHSLITRDPSKAQVHVTNLFALNYESLTGHLKTLREQYHCDFSRIIAFRPTGWSYKPKPGDNTTDPNLAQLIARNYSSSPMAYSHKTFTTTRDSTPTVRIYNVPYSEHSSFLELTCFMVGLGCQAGWSRVVPTVNVGNRTSRKKMDAWIKKWKEEANRRKKKGVKGCEDMARAREYF